MQKVKPEIIGILYRDDDGNLQIINDSGSYDVLIDPPDDVLTPVPAAQLTPVNMVHVDWGNGADWEYWAEDMWHDCLDDMKDDGREDVAEIFERNKNNVFRALLIG